MANSAKGGWRVNRLAMGVFVFGAIVLVLGLVLAFQFVGPPPPRHIVLATGVDGGAYQSYGEQLARYLNAEGVNVELRATAGAVENLALLQSESGIDVAFVQGGLVEDAAPEGITALGSFYLEPIWVFVRTDIAIASVADLTGKRLAVGAAGSGTRVVVKRLLTANGVDATMLDVAADGLTAAFSAGDLDAAFLIGGAESESVAELVALDEVKLLGLSRAAAYARRAPYLTQVTLPQGVLDLRSDKPASDTETVAVAAMLAVNEQTHPAIIDLLMIAASDVFDDHTILSAAGEFPSPANIDLPLSPEAKRFHERGAPFLMRYLPFWGGDTGRSPMGSAFFPCSVC